jgi:hypothetical protein
VALAPHAPTHGSSQREQEEAAIYHSYQQHLVQLQLLKPSFGMPPHKGVMPEFDNSTGMIKASGYDLTSLGRLLLKRIDMTPNETQQS